VLGLEAHAAAFYDAVLKVDEDFQNRISQRSMMYWKRAATRPLYLAPDEDDDDAIIGPKFLISHEARKAQDGKNVTKNDNDKNPQAASKVDTEAAINP
jgi:hypothetical protein